ncbi:glycosyltransferase family 4 protein [Maricaulis sp.]|uniref:glycosyltransferase family 4 protein n=1 Tax=Maricaulis sp. TaxID=1486257 RepID=UPI0032984211
MAGLGRGAAMHILVTVNAAWNVLNFRRPVIEMLLAEGHKVTVLAPPDDSVGAMAQMGCRFEPLEMSVKGLNPLDDFALFRRLSSVFGRLRPDIVLSYTIKNNIFGAMAAREVGIPFVPNVTGLGTAFLSGGLLQRIAETLYRQAFGGLPVVFFQNEDDRDLFLSRRLARAEQARLLPGSGINLQHFAPTGLPSSRIGPVFLMIARLLRDKGVVEYVDAARLVRQQIPEAEFRVLGAVASQNRSAIDRDTVAAWEADGAITYLGTMPDVRPAISEAHCVVLPSYREGAPRTLIEAAAMGRPLIATDVPGCRSVVAHEHTGFLCEVRSAQSLAEACLRFAAMSHDARTELGRAGRAKMETEYDEAVVVRAYRGVLDELMSGRRAGTM